MSRPAFLLLLLSDLALVFLQKLLKRLLLRQSRWMDGALLEGAIYLTGEEPALI